MIFKPELAKLIRQGKKSMHRRPVNGRDCRYQPGRSYALQPGRGQASIGRITITDVRQERLGDMPVKDARREGFATRQEFFDHWKGLRRGRLDLDQLVWVISFAVGDLTDTPRLLAERPGAPHGDYVSQSYLALREAGEALSDVEQERYSRLARARDAERISDPLRQSRDRIAKELVVLRDGVSSSSRARNTIRRLEKELQVLDRQLAA